LRTTAESNVPIAPTGVQVEHGLVVGLGVCDLVVDGGVEKHGSIGHAVPFRNADCPTTVSDRD
jgi:hypothetical protein